jgi:uncharacterized protein YqgV (UPF0045/DUF77 family)
MIITVEMSMYPFDENYLELIGGFIEKLNLYPDLKIATSATSTIVVGEFQYVMKTITEMLAWSYETHGKAVFVTKFIPGHDPDVMSY